MASQPEPALYCRVCHRPLTDSEAQAKGVGPICAERLKAARKIERRQEAEGLGLGLEEECER